MITDKGNISIQEITKQDQSEFFKLIDKNRENLRLYLTWLDMTQKESDLDNMRYLKPLLTGTYMHQSLSVTFSFIEENLLGKGKVYFKSSKRLLDSYNEEIERLHSTIRKEFDNKCNGLKED